MFININFKKKYTWLVTGSSGFIGTNITKYLIENDQYVIGIDTFITGNIKNLEYLKKIPNSKKLFLFKEGDLSDEKFVKKIFNKDIDFVLHQAALGSVPRSIKNPFNTNINNVNASLNIFYYASQNKKIKKVVFASSGSVYGDIKDSLKTENKIGNQLSPYAASKRIVEIYAETFNQCYNLNYVALRYFNVFGPHQNNKGIYPTVISGWISNILKNKQITVFGDGKQTRDFCYVKRIVEANILSALNKNIVNEILNISGGKSISLNKLVKIFQDLFPDKKIKVKYENPRKGDVKNSKANLHKAEKILNLSANDTIEKYLIDTVKWYKQFK